MKVRTLLRNGGTHLALGAYALFLVFPLLWMLSTSFKSTADIYSGVVSLIPGAFSLEHYRTVMTE